jgi:uncharacterized protein YrrD
MKKSREIIGLPVLDVSRGELLEKVSSLVIDPENGKVAYLLLERPSQFAEMRLLDFQDVLGIGDYAVATEKEENVRYISQDKKALPLLEKNVQILNAKVLSRKGLFLGTVQEITIDEETGQITACEVSPAGGNSKSFQVSREEILTFGKTHLVVKEPVSVKQPPPPGDRESSPERPFNGNADQDIIELFQEQQMKYLLGRKCKATIKDKEGNTIIAEGQIIDENIIRKAQETDTYIELSMYAE